MAKQKTNKDYYRAYRQKKGDLYKANDAARKKLKEKKYEVFKKKETARLREYRLKAFTVLEQLQVSAATSASGTTPTTSSPFSTKQILH